MEGGDIIAEKARMVLEFDGIWVGWRARRDPLMSLRATNAISLEKLDIDGNGRKTVFNLSSNFLLPL